MKAVIFAAGEGKRLHPLTLERPKPLVEVLGKSLIEHLWDVLPSEIKEVIIVVGYKGDMIRDFLGSEFNGKKVTYIEQVEPLGTAHALGLCKAELEHEKNFLLLYPDDIHDKKAVLECTKNESSILVSFVDDPRRFGVIVPNEDGTVKNIEEKPEHPKSNLAATGVYVLTPNIFKYEATHAQGGEYFITDMIAGYIHDNPVNIVEGSFWIPIAYPHDIERAEGILAGMPK